MKLIDFGSSCFTTDHLTTYIQSRSYRAPEVILGLPYTQKIDLWSLGCILAEVLTGRTLFGQDPIASLSVDFDAPGDYSIALEIDVTNGPVDFTDALFGGVLVDSFGETDGPATLAYDVTVEAPGPQVLTWQLNTEPDFYNLAVTYFRVIVDGPLVAQPVHAGNRAIVAGGS